MRIELIHPPHPNSTADRLDPPMGLLYIAAYLEQNSISVGITDLSGLDMASWHIPQADIYGITAYVSSLEITQVIVQYCKVVNPDCKIVVGGAHPSACPEDFPYADFVVVGPGEVAMYEIARGRSTDRIIIGEQLEDPFLLPAFHLIEPTSYHRKIDGKTSLPFLTSRGCPFFCSFCGLAKMHELGHGVKMAAPERVAEHIKQIKKLGINRISFQDDIFTLDAARLHKLLDLIEPLDIKFRCMGRAGIDAAETYERLAAAGCVEVAWGIESGCFTADTKISLLDGTEKSFSELVKNYSDKQFWVYSCNNKGNIVPGKAHSPRRTGARVPVLRIILDNGEEIKCTHGHKFLMRDGSYKEAQYLLPQDSLMPLYRKREILYDTKDYEQLYNPGTGEWLWTHKISDHLLLKGPGRIRHHKDFNRFNNSPDNLEFVTKGHHLRLHAAQNAVLNKRPKTERQLEASRLNGFRASQLPKTKKQLENASKMGKMIRNVNQIKHSMKNLEILWSLPRTAKQTASSKITIIGTQKIAWGLPRTALQINNAKKLGTLPRSISQIDAGRKVGRLNTGNHTRWHVSRNIVDPNCSLCRPVNHKVISVEAAGFEDVYDLTVEGYHNFALSSGVVVHNSQYMLDRMQKQVKVQDNYNVIQWAKKYGITSRAFFIIGFPGETKDTLEETKEFIIRADPDQYFVSSFVPYPGTDVALNPTKYGITNITEDKNQFYQVSKDGTGGLTIDTQWLSREEFRRLELGFRNWLKYHRKRRGFLQDYEQKLEGGK